MPADEKDVAGGMWSDFLESSSLGLGVSFLQDFPGRAAVQHLRFLGPMKGRHGSLAKFGCNTTGGRVRNPGPSWVVVQNDLPTSVLDSPDCGPVSLLHLYTPALSTQPA